MVGHDYDSEHISYQNKIIKLILSFIKHKKFYSHAKNNPNNRVSFCYQCPVIQSLEVNVNVLLQFLFPACQQKDFSFKF